ncbi:OB-fold domain-containing protein [soil metagenome]
MSTASNVEQAAAPMKPMPEPNALSREYWENAAQGRLVLQTCGSCGKIRHYPRLICDNCYSDEVFWTQSTAAGKLHSWTICTHAFHPAFKDDLPYTLVTVDLEEGVRAMGRWPSEEPLSIGLLVQGQFVPREGGVDLTFTPVKD